MIEMRFTLENQEGNEALLFKTLEPLGAPPGRISVTESKLHFDLRDRLYFTDTSGIPFSKNIKTNKALLHPGQHYLVRLEYLGELDESHASFWIIQYSDKARLRHDQSKLSGDGLRISLTTHPNAMYFGFGIRLTGNGNIGNLNVRATEFSLGRILSAPLPDAPSEILDCVEMFQFLNRTVKEDVSNLYYKKARDLIDAVECCVHLSRDQRYSALAILFECTNNYEAALYNYKRLRSEVSRLPQEAYLGLARCQSALGNYKAADSLYQPRRTLATTDRHISYYKRHVQARNAWAADVLEDIAFSDESSGSKASVLLQSAMLLRGYDPEVSHKLLSFYRGLETVRTEADQDYARPNSIIFTSGFGWSGTGAVNEWMIGFDGLATPFGLGELPFFNGKAATEGLAALFSRACRGDLHKSDIRRFIFSNILVDEGISRVFKRGDSETLVLGFASSTRRLLSECDSSVEEGRQRCALYLLANCFSELATSSSDGARCFFNNLIFPKNLFLLEFFGAAQCIAVKRDVRDQFTAQCIERRTGPPTVGQFCDNLAKQISVYQESRATYGDRIIEVQFEKFVLDSFYRDELATALCLRSAHFHPDRSTVRFERSRQNVGIYRQHPDRAAIKEIEAQFPQLCVV